MLTDTANFQNPHYHQATDKIETLNLDFLSQVAAGVAVAVMELAGNTLGVYGFICFSTRFLRH